MYLSSYQPELFPQLAHDHKKKVDQPSRIKTCGSTFKNPEGNKAWKLIKDSGCAGISIGDAAISEKHCNFFINKANPKSRDL